MKYNTKAFDKYVVRLMASMLVAAAVAYIGSFLFLSGELNEGALGMILFVIAIVGGTWTAFGRD